MKRALATLYYYSSRIDQTKHHINNSCLSWGNAFAAMVVVNLAGAHNNTHVVFICQQVPIKRYLGSPNANKISLSRKQIPNNE
jgi:hypothetical protein